MDITYVIFSIKKVFFSSHNSKKTGEELTAEKFAETLVKLLYVSKFLLRTKSD